MTAADQVDTTDLARAGELLGDITEAFAAKVVGQERLRTSMLVALLAEGHLLVESLPGLAKTLASSTLAHAMKAPATRGSSARPTCCRATSSAPSSTTHRSTSSRPSCGPCTPTSCCSTRSTGPAPRRSRRCSRRCRSGRPRSPASSTSLPRPFLVLATQNPIEQEGTYILPEAQMDRFLLKEVLDYPESGGGGRRARPGEPMARSTTPRPGPASSTRAQIRDLQGSPAASTSTRRSSATSSTSCTRPATPARRSARSSARTSTRGRARGRPSRSSGSRGPWRCSPAATTSSPRTSSELRHGVLRHRLHLTFEALADQVPPETIIDAVFAAVPTP